MVSYADLLASDYTYVAREQVEREAAIAQDMARDIASAEAQAASRAVDDAVNAASDRVTEVEDLNTLSLTQLQQAMKDYTTSEKEEVLYYFDDTNWKTYDYTYWEGGQVEDETEKAKNTVLAIIDKTIEEAKGASAGAFDLSFEWLEEQFGVIGEAFSFAFSFLAARLEDLLEIPARVLFDLFVGLFFEEEEIAET